MRTRWEEGENSGKESKMKRDRIMSYFICFCLCFLATLHRETCRILVP